MRRFVTQKLSWNRTNPFPHHTFWWEGLDGSRVLTHFPPVDTYGAEITPRELAPSVERFAEHGWSRWSLVPYGYGDGGGGPTREMLERAARLADLDGMPTVQLGSPADFFDRRRGRGGRRRAGSGVARRAVLRDPSRHVDEPAAHEARQPAVREAAARDRAAGRDGGRPRWRGRPARARRHLARRAHPAVPRHPARLVDRLGARRRRGGLRAHRRRSRAADRGQVVGARASRAALVNAATSARAEVVVVDGTPPGDGSGQRLADGRTAVFVAAPGLGMAPLFAGDARRPGRGHRPVDGQRSDSP